MTIRELIENGTITLDTKVLGTLPITEDGVVVGPETIVYWPDGTEALLHDSRAWVPHKDGGHTYRRITDCYSTREAAEAARVVA